MENSEEVEHVFVSGAATEPVEEPADDGLVYVAGRPVAPRGS
ncbi:hypothetical protein [Halorubellus sp. PRR65]|nr:hypothetical protein [Halorubellus sp. PRR65]